jgi:hypothetical protein
MGEGGGEQARNANAGRDGQQARGSDGRNAGSAGGNNPAGPGMRQAARPAGQRASEQAQSVFVDARSQARDGVTLAPLSEIERQGGDTVNVQAGSLQAGTAGSAGVASAIESAAQGAQRGIENQAVPPARSDLVRRVFERYATRARPATGESAAQPQQGTQGEAGRAPASAPAATPASERKE